MPKNRKLSTKLPMKKAIFFDRDGTLIIDKVYLNNPDEITYLPGVFESLKMLRDKGFVFLIATNQSGLARGIVQIENMDLIHLKMKQEFSKCGIDLLNFYYAPYSVTSGHFARKPNPGMLFYGARDYNIDLKNSWMVGDRMTDVLAGKAAGCKTVLLEGVENINTISGPERPDFIARDLPTATEFILSITGSEH